MKLCHSLLIIIVFSLISLSVTALAVANPVTTTKLAVIKSNPPTTVIFGVYPIDIYNFDMAKNNFSINFYTWWRTTDPNYNPAKSVEIVNATHYEARDLGSGKNANEYFYHLHYYATIHKNWDITAFPFDRQYLTVQLEDFSNKTQVIFQPDSANSHIHHELQLPGWKILGLTLKESTILYNTNFGNINNPKIQHSRLTFVIEIQRLGWRLYFNYFIGYFVSAFLCAFTYIIYVNNLVARMSLILGAIFACVTNKYVVDQLLPFSNELTLGYGIKATTFIMILVAVITCALLSYLEEKKMCAAFRTTNYIIGVTSMVAYIIIVSCFTLVAIH